MIKTHQGVRHQIYLPPSTPQNEATVKAMVTMAFADYPDLDNVQIMKYNKQFFVEFNHEPTNDSYITGVIK